MEFKSNKYRDFVILRSDLIDHFWSKIDKSGTTLESQAAMLAGRVQTPCHLWLGCKVLGYGGFRCRPQLRSHILAYFLVKNDLPQERGLELDHLCHVRHCCNPDHLEPVTSLVNVGRGRSHKIFDLDAITIHLRKSQGWSIKRIAGEFRLSQRYVLRILSGERFNCAFKEVGNVWS